MPPVASEMISKHAVDEMTQIKALESPYHNEPYNDTSRSVTVRYTSLGYSRTQTHTHTHTHTHTRTHTHTHTHRHTHTHTYTLTHIYTGQHKRATLKLTSLCMTTRWQTVTGGEVNLRDAITKKLVPTQNYLKTHVKLMTTALLKSGLD